MCIVPTATTQRQIFLYYDVVTHKQPVCQEARYREKVATYSPCRLVAGDFNGAAWRRPCGNDRKLTSIIEEAFADTNLPVRCRVNGLMYVGLSSHRTPMISDRYACKVPSLSPTTLWVSRKKIKAATTRCGCISLMPTLEAIALHLKDRASPYDHSTQKSRAHREQSDHSRNS